MSIHRRIKTEAGFSLIELLIGMALLALLLAPLATSLSSIVKSYQYNMSQARNVASTRDTLNTLADEFRYATTISVAVDTTSTIPGATITYTVGGQSRTISAVAGTPSTTYTLVIAYAGITQKNIAINNLQSITFTRFSANTKLLNVTVTENNLAYTGSPTMTTSTTITMQNM